MKEPLRTTRDAFSRVSAHNRFRDRVVVLRELFGRSCEPRAPFRLYSTDARVSEFISFLLARRISFQKNAKIRLTDFCHPKTNLTTCTRALGF